MADGKSFRENNLKIIVLEISIGDTSRAEITHISFKTTTNDAVCIQH